MKILIKEKISEHRYKTPEGYLICVDSVLARTGKQTYRRNEVFHDDSDMEVEIDRSPDEVFSEATLASFENKPLTVEHPDEDVNIENYRDYAVGFVRDIKRGMDNGQEVMLGTLVITDAQTIEEIENGEHTDLSCGYDCDIADEENPQQRNIRGNHVALCREGRAGIARIVDSINDADSLEKTYKGYRIVAVSVGYKNAPTEVTAYDDKHQFKSIFSSEEKLTEAINNFIKYNMKEVPLTRANRKYIDNYLSMISTFTSRDVDIKDLLRPLSGKGFNWSVDKIEGWKWTSGEYARKYYYISLDGYTDRFLVTLYADPEQDWKVKEVNAYFTDSVEDSTNLYYVEFTLNGQQHWTNVRANSEEDAMRRIFNSFSNAENISVHFTKTISDSVHDVMLEISSSEINEIERMFKQKNIKVVAKGKTIMRRLHYQVEYNGHPRVLAFEFEKIDDYLLKQGIEMTWSANGNAVFSTAGVDFMKWGKKSTSDSKLDKAVKIAKMLSTKDASYGHEIVVLTERYLESLGKNNSIGKYDRIIQGVKSLLEQGFLGGPELEKAVKQQTDRLLKKYSLDSAKHVVKLISDANEIDEFYDFMNNANGHTKSHTYKPCVKAAEEIPRFSKMSPTVENYWNKCEMAYNDFVNFVNNMRTLAREAEKIAKYDDADSRPEAKKFVQSKGYRKGGVWYWRIVGTGEKHCDESLKTAKYFYDKAKAAYDKLKGTK